MNDLEIRGRLLVAEAHLTRLRRVLTEQQQNLSAALHTTEDAAVAVRATANDSATILRAQHADLDHIVDLLDIDAAETLLRDA